MITGDHPRTAAVIAPELGIATDRRAITGAEIEAAGHRARPDGRGCPCRRVNPEHKLRIVKSLQRDGATVAMTGDGVKMHRR